MGEGAFGKVKRVEKKKGKANYALKYIDKKKCIEKGATINIFRERILLQRLNHPFIVNLRYAFQDDDNLFMVIDLAEGGDLRNHLDRMKGMKDDTLRIYAAEIGCALNYLHQNKIIHRYSINNTSDLKPENLLLDRNGHLLLTDFNVSVNLAEATPTSPSGTRPYMGMH
jgi:serine/threonine kinase 32